MRTRTTTPSGRRSTRRWPCVLAELDRGGRRRVASASRHGVRIVPRGAGTGLSGGANAVDRLHRAVAGAHDRVLRDRRRTSGSPSSQPGVVNDDLRAAVAEHGLWYPPDPASSPWSTIGGNVATNAGGICCVKYGVTRDYVLGLRWSRRRLDRPAGPAHRQGRRRATTSPALMVGSEGTLGIITEVDAEAAPARRPASAPWSATSPDRRRRRGGRRRRRGRDHPRPPSSSSTGTACRPSTTGSSWG